jgi:hypothetical protein
MKRKPMGWVHAGLMFAIMAVGTVGLDTVLSVRLRHQIWSASPDFWLDVFPGDLLGFAIIAIGMRFLLNWSLANRNRASLEPHQSSRS